jgi:glycosyltransferase involved in cell wall biosynthesis
VLPSLFEGLPLSILEAMTAGKAIVATAIGGTDEAIVDGITGLLVPPADFLNLAAGIRKLVSDPVLATRLAAAGRERAVQAFSAEAMVGGVTRVYDELLLEKSAAETVQTAERIETHVNI